MSEILASQNPEQTIDRVRPGHGSVVQLDGGDNRDVFVVDDHEAFRFAKDSGGIEVGRYEFEVLKLLQGRMSIDIPEPIELAEDGSYNVLSFLPGKVLSKYAVTELPLEKRRTLGIDIANVINELNTEVSRDDLKAIPTTRSLVRNRDEFYLRTYDLALRQDGEHAAI